MCAHLKREVEIKLNIILKYLRTDATNEGVKLSWKLMDKVFVLNYRVSVCSTKEAIRLPQLQIVRKYIHILVKSPESPLTTLNIKHLLI